VDDKDTSFIIVDNSCNNNSWNTLYKHVHEYLNVAVNEIHILDNIKTYQLNGDCQIILARSPYNGGFAKGNNIGAKVATKIFKPQYLLFTNNDILFNHQIDIKLLTRHMNDKSNIAVVGPKIVGLNGKPQSPAKKVDIYHRWIYPMMLYPLGNYISKISKVVQQSGDTIKNADSGIVYRVMGAFMLCDANKFYECGMFDENTFLYGEEMILSERLEHYGYKVYYEDVVCITHEGGYTTKESHKGVDINGTKRRFESEMYYYHDYCGIGNGIIGIAKALMVIYEFKVKLVRGLSKIKHYLRGND
jgi:GT2 family glycosyltransferase